MIAASSTFILMLVIALAKCQDSGVKQHSQHLPGNGAAHTAENFDILPENVHTRRATGSHPGSTESLLQHVLAPSYCCGVPSLSVPLACLVCGMSDVDAGRAPAIPLHPD